MSYPKFLYHVNFPEGKIFENAQEEIEAGDDWVDSPVLLTQEVIKPIKKGKK